MNIQNELFSKDMLLFAKERPQFDCLIRMMKCFLKNKTLKSVETKRRLDLFFRTFRSEIQLNQFYENEMIRQKFNLSRPDFSSTYELGMFCLMDLKHKNANQNFGRHGAIAKSRKYDEIKRFVQEKYFQIHEKNPDMSANTAAYKISRIIIEEFKDSPVMPSNLMNCINSWISKIKKNGKII